MQNFSVIDNEVTMDFKPRHGTIISRTKKELNTLLKNGEGQPVSLIDKFVPGNKKYVQL